MNLYNIYNIAITDINKLDNITYQEYIKISDLDYNILTNNIVLNDTENQLVATR